MALFPMHQNIIRVRPVSLIDLNEARLAPFVIKHGHLSVHQVPAIADIISEDARLAAYEFFEESGQMAGYAIVKIRHRILADISFGPVVMHRDLFIPCLNALKPALRRMGLLLLRVYPPYDAPDFPGIPAKFNWATSVVDISRSEEDLLKSFSPNHRQSIRKAASAGIRVQDLKAGDVAAYVKGHVAMFARRGIPKSEAESLGLVGGLHQLCGDESANGFMLSAHTGDSDHLVGGGIFLCNGDTCDYYQGYADRTEPPLPVLHLVLWEAMKRARAMGCLRFDLSGISLDDNDIQLKAVNDFKRWFRGEIIRYPATVVVPLYSFMKPVLRLAGQRI